MCLYCPILWAENLVLPIPSLSGIFIYTWGSSLWIVNTASIFSHVVICPVTLWYQLQFFNLVPHITELHRKVVFASFFILKIYLLCVQCSACIYAFRLEEGTGFYFRQLWATMWCWELLRTSGSAASAPSLWAISPAQSLLLKVDGLFILIFWYRVSLC